MATKKEADLALSYYQDELFKNENLAFIAVFQRTDDFGESLDEFYLKAGVQNLQQQESHLVEFVGSKSLDKVVPNELYIPKNKRSKSVTSKKIVIEFEETEGLSPQSFLARDRPSRGGNSIFNFRYNDFGTLGAAFKIKNNNNVFILSNWHVMSGPSGVIGDNILQPSPHDGGTNPSDTIAKLYWRGLNQHIDAAIARAISPNNILKRHTKCFGPLGNLQTAQINMKVKKCGRSTRQTFGKVVSTNASGWVSGNYPNGKFFFTNQIMTSKMSTDGDSGSLLVNQSNNNVVGLLFADNPTYSIANHIKYVLKSNITVFGINESIGIDGEAFEFDRFL